MNTFNRRFSFILCIKRIKKGLQIHVHQQRIWRNYIKTIAEFETEYSVSILFSNCIFEEIKLDEKDRELLSKLNVDRVNRGISNGSKCGVC